MYFAAGRFNELTQAVFTRALQFYGQRHESRCRAICHVTQDVTKPLRSQFPIQDFKDFLKILLDDPYKLNVY